MPQSPWVCNSYIPGLQLRQQRRADARRFVTAFRLWMDANGGSVGWAPGVSTELPARESSREALLDRYNSHTKHCPSCTGVSAALIAPGNVLCLAAPCSTRIRENINKIR